MNWQKPDIVVTVHLNVMDGKIHMWMVIKQGIEDQFYAENPYI